MIRALFNQHKKKIFYTIGILFLINLSLMVSDKGILISEDCFINKKANSEPTEPNVWEAVNCSEYRKRKFNNPWNDRTECTYWFGRGTFYTVMDRFDYCKFTEELQ